MRRMAAWLGLVRKEVAVELLGVPSGLAATFPFLRPHLCCCLTREKLHGRFILHTRRLSAPPPPSPSRAQLDPSSKHIHKAQFAKAKKAAIEQLDRQLSEGVKAPYVEYLMDLNLDLQDIRRILERYPYIQYRSVDEQIRPLVEFLLNLGMDHSGLIRVLRTFPQIVSASIEKRIMKNMAYIESLGMDKAMCVKALRRHPRLFVYRKEKLEATVAYFLELGVSTENMVKIIVLFPQVFAQSVEEKIKPTTAFFLDKGFTPEELIKIAVRFTPIYSLSLTKSLIPKWEFFLEMGYPKSSLVSFPPYFGYSLEGRIKPRLKCAKEHGLQLCLNYLLRPTNRDFEMMMKKSVSRSVKDGGECSA